jgi:hypothetical protein
VCEKERERERERERKKERKRERKREVCRGAPRSHRAVDGFGAYDTQAWNMQ